MSGLDAQSYRRSSLTRLCCLAWGSLSRQFSLQTRLTSSWCSRKVAIIGTVSILSIMMVHTFRSVINFFHVLAPIERSVIKRSVIGDADARPIIVH